MEAISAWLDQKAQIKEFSISKATTHNLQSGGKWQKDKTWIAGKGAWVSLKTNGYFFLIYSDGKKEWKAADKDKKLFVPKNTQIVSWKTVNTE